MTPIAGRLESYFGALADLTSRLRATDASGNELSAADAIAWAVKTVTEIPARGGKVMFIGNGGSAGIASHMAIDFSKNGGIPALAFNDAASLTCLANDLGYDKVFAHHVETLGKPEDLLVAISSSGRSRSILEAVEAARRRSMPVLTLSGFTEDNPLRGLGDMNLYVPSDQYGFVEIGHLTVCHAILDLAIGWQP